MMPLKDWMKNAFYTGAGFTFGYLINEARRNKKFRVGLFGGSAVLFTVYTLSTKLGPGCMDMIDKQNQRQYQIEEQKIQNERQKDSLAHIDKTLTTNVIPPPKSTLDDKINASSSPVPETRGNNMNSRNSIAEKQSSQYMIEQKQQDYMREQKAPQYITEDDRSFAYQQYTPRVRIPSMFPPPSMRYPFPPFMLERRIGIRRYPRSYR
jgi:hypothetical protein